MHFGIIATIVAVVLALVASLVQKFRADSAVAGLRRQDRSKETEEIGKLTEEVANAKLDYKRERDQLDSSLSTSPGPDGA